MQFLKKYIGDLFLPARFYFAIGACMLFFILAFFIPSLYTIARGIFYLLILLIFADYLFLFVIGKPPVAIRLLNDRLSNGDDNKISVRIKNRMNFDVYITLLDELPVQLQNRSFSIRRKFPAREEKIISYTIRPKERGVYEFGRILLYVSSRLGLVTKRFEKPASKSVSVFPSFMNLRQYQIISNTTLINEAGSKRVRKIGQSMEFEQIKDYVTGDDVRNINWKATARKGLLMVNNYTDEKSQQVYCIVDKGRLMKMPFGGLTLLDYAINSTLVMSSVCLQKQDRIGLLTFSDKIGSVIAADRNPIQREKILQVLYKQQTAFLESDFEMLYLQIRSKIRQRSLLILFTNFESVNGLNRQIGYLRSIARHHLLLVVFFENTELTSLAHADALNVEDVYIKTIADKFVFEKKLVVKELQKYGILSILTSPQKLTVDTVNKYLELKSKQAL